MINTEKVVGFYTDVFGNEIDEYEQIERYSVVYKGALFVDDEDGWNKHGVDNLEDAMHIYHAYNGEIYIRDNQYGCIFENGEWHE